MPNYKEISIRDLSIGPIRRLEAIITTKAANDLTKIAVLKKATLKIYRREQPHALTVKAFKPGDEIKPGTWTVGSTIYAPHGEWKLAGTIGNMAMDIKLGPAIDPKEQKQIDEVSNEKLYKYYYENSLIHAYSNTIG